MTTYQGTDEFEGATFVKTSFRGATWRYADLTDATMRSVDVDGLDIDSHYIGGFKDWAMRGEPVER